jgi:hypothetical protein
MKAKRTFIAAVGLALALFAREPAGRATSPLSKIHAIRAAEHTIALDTDAARKELEGADADDPDVAIERGRLAIYEENCDSALLALSSPQVLQDELGAGLADIARGCARVTASTVVERDDARSIVVRFQDEADRALMPLLVDTVVKARDMLTRDLHVDWPKPTRVTVVRDLLSLSAMTGLPYESARTTGTVAVAKWGRVTLLSPRASRHGFAWRDTLTHELTHLAVTRATADRAPLWLQEGVAKRQEVRWREPGPFDDRPSPDAVVVRGIELKLDIPLDKLGPSIAMLPSADAAMVAFAEVTSFVRYYATAAGEDALPKLFAELKARKSPDDALTAASGATLSAWDKKWRGYLGERPRESLSALFGLGEDPKALLELRERSRLAELLIGRSHPVAALVELDRVKGNRIALEDPHYRYLRARSLEALSKPEDARAALDTPKAVQGSFAPWWAIRGRLLRPSDAASADVSFFEAVSNDPYDPEASCETLDEAVVPADPAAAALCRAARAKGDPLLGQD